MGWTDNDRMIDLLSDAIRCDFCDQRKERRYFAEIADGENYFSRCQDCKDFQDKVDANLDDAPHCASCECRNVLSPKNRAKLQDKVNKLAEAIELHARHGE